MCKAAFIYFLGTVHENSEQVEFESERNLFNVEKQNSETGQNEVKLSS